MGDPRPQYPLKDRPWAWSAVEIRSVCWASVFSIAHSTACTGTEAGRRGRRGSTPSTPSTENPGTLVLIPLVPLVPLVPRVPLEPLAPRLPLVTNGDTGWYGDPCSMTSKLSGGGRDVCVHPYTPVYHPCLGVV